MRALFSDCELQDLDHNAGQHQRVYQGAQVHKSAGHDAVEAFPKDADPVVQVACKGRENNPQRMRQKAAFFLFSLSLCDSHTRACLYYISTSYIV